MILNWSLNQKGNEDTVGAAGGVDGAPGLEGGVGADAGGCIAVAEESVFPLGKHPREPRGVMVHQAYNLLSNSSEMKCWRGEEDGGRDRVKLGALGEGGMADLCTSLATFLEMCNY